MPRRTFTVRSVLVGLVFVAATQPAPVRADVPPAVPRAVCGPGSVPESAAQGRVLATDYATGLRCNMELLGHTGAPIGGFRTHRYVDAAGHECAYYDTSPLLPSNRAALADPQATGTFVVDMADPAHPVITDSLNTPAMRSPHESLSVHAGRGLLAANMGTGVTLPGFVDVYDLTQDCRHPRLLSSLPLGVIGHEGSFSPDGMTYWVSAGAGFFTGTQHGTLIAVDVSSPALPSIAWASAVETGHGLNVGLDGNTLYYADVGPGRGLAVLDVSQVQARVPNPQVRHIGHATWDTVAIPQTDIPVTIGGHPYLVSVDEFTHNSVPRLATGGNFSDPADPVGAARIIDVADPTAPHVVSDIRLEVNSPEARAGEQAVDPGANSIFGYAAHYCSVPKAADPGIVACSFILSGLRVFDIRDPLHPAEIAYFNPPGTAAAPYVAMSAPAFVQERGEIWYTDGNYGFYALKVTNGAWPS